MSYRTEVDTRRFVHVVSVHRKLFISHMILGDRSGLTQMASGRDPNGYVSPIWSPDSGPIYMTFVSTYDHMSQ